MSLVATALAGCSTCTASKAISGSTAVGFAGPRRGRPHVRHGLPSGHPEDRLRPAQAAGNPCSSRRRCRRRSERLADDHAGPPSTWSELADSAQGRDHRSTSLYPRSVRGASGTLLEHLLRAGLARTAIVFTRTKHRAERLAQQLDRARATAPWRSRATCPRPSEIAPCAASESGRFDVLVATDIAARGIDVTHVGKVINFDMPTTPEAYTHRIGRTGRSDQAGEACTFVTGDDRSMVRSIERMIGSEIPRTEVPGLTEAPTPQGQGLRPARAEPPPPPWPPTLRAPRRPLALSRPPRPRPRRSRARGPASRCACRWWHRC